jgi:hypothetical protein
MKKMIIVLAVICITAVGLASCTAQSGCKGTQGYVGYGNR